MVMALTAISHFFPTVKPAHLLIRGIASTEKILSAVLPFFKTGSALFFFGYATKELCCDVTVESESHLNSRVDQCRQSVLPDDPPDYSRTHGILFIGAGICSAFEALHEFAVFNLDKFYPLMAWGGTGLFLFANLVALKQNIDQYIQAIGLSTKGSEQDRHKALLMMKSAVLGIISNFGYITATAIALLGAPTAIALVVGCVSACFGGLKILHDFYCFYLQKTKVHRDGLINYNFI